MRRHHAALLALLLAGVPVTAQGNLGTYEDRIAVEDVMARYVWAVDSLDADGYVAVFTEDAVIDSNGSISRGREEIRRIVTSLVRRRDASRAKGLPAANLYHVISNVRITFPKADEALHQSYWQTVRRDENGTMTCGRDGPVRRPARQARRRVADSVAHADRLHRLIVCSDRARPFARFRCDGCEPESPCSLLLQDQGDLSVVRWSSHGAFARGASGEPRRKGDRKRGRSSA